MPSYSTIEEKASTWNISTRHIQYLCRAGKINGAVKRAGSWSIPDDTPSPAKNSKSNDQSVKFVGTKRRIFFSAIELSVLRGFSNVRFRDIAEDLGIRQSIIYYHFKTKEDLLDSIYEFYCNNFFRERMSLTDMKSVVRNESLTDIVECIRYVFKEDYRETMLKITIIIFQRLGIDERARELMKSLLIREGIDYVESVFNEAVEIGRLAPFDTHIMAVFINIVRIFTLYCWILEPEQSHGSRNKLHEDEQALYRCALELLVDLKPVKITGY